MSSSYEAIFAHTSAITLRKVVEETSPRMPFVYFADAGFAGACLRMPRSSPFSPEKLCALAERVAFVSSRAVAIFFDDRTGVREAIVFDVANQPRRFSAEDERWSPLNDDGEPEPGVALSLGELGNREGHCVLSAIDLALGQIGADPVTSRRLHGAAGTAV